MNTNTSFLASYAIGLVLYHPEEFLLKRVDNIVKLGYRLYVFDNSPFDSKYSNEIQLRSNVTYLTAGKNVGIGYSLSILSATAYAQGYQHLLFLDQDTGISSKTLEFIEKFSQSLPINIQQQYALLAFRGNASIVSTVQDVRLAISSGSLFNLPVLKKIGWHNEKYFVDCVDYELCLRAKRNGFKIGLIDNTPDFDHMSEQPDRLVSVLGKLVSIRRYSTARIKDSLKAYLKLIFYSLFLLRVNDTCLLIKSAFIYIGKQFISRLILEKK